MTKKNGFTKLVKDLKNKLTPKKTWSCTTPAFGRYSKIPDEKLATAVNEVVNYRELVCSFKSQHFEVIVPLAKF